MAVSFIAGPLAGGFLTDHVGWRSVFLVNLPIGIAALAAVTAVLPASIGRSERRGTPLDVAGIALLTLAVGLLLVGLSMRSHPDAAGHVPGWLRADTGGLLAAGALVAALFVAVERRAVAPVIPLGLLADRRTGPILLAAATGAFGLFAGALLLPRDFQTVRGVSATHSGLLIYPLLLGLLVSVNVAGAAVPRRGALRRTLLAGSVLAGAGALGFATFDAGTPDWQSLAFMALIGVGVGPMLSGGQIAIQRTVAPAAIGARDGHAHAAAPDRRLDRARRRGAIYAAGTGHGAATAPAATATGHAVFAVTLARSAVAAVALLALPRASARLPLPPAAAPAAV